MAGPLPDAAGPNSMPIAEKETGEKEAGPALGEASGGTAPAEKALDKKDTSTPASPPS